MRSEQTSLVDWLAALPSEPEGWQEAPVRVAMLRGQGWRARWADGAVAVVGLAGERGWAWIAALGGQADAQPTTSPEEGRAAAERWLARVREGL